MRELPVRKNPHLSQDSSGSVVGLFVNDPQGGSNTVFQFGEKQRTPRGELNGRGGAKQEEKNTHTIAPGANSNFWWFPGRFGGGGVLLEGGVLNGYYGKRYSNTKQNTTRMRAYVGVQWTTFGPALEQQIREVRDLTYSAPTTVCTSYYHGYRERPDCMHNYQVPPL